MYVDDRQGLVDIVRSADIGIAITIGLAPVLRLKPICNCLGTSKASPGHPGRILLADAITKQELALAPKVEQYWIYAARDGLPFGKERNPGNPREVAFPETNVDFSGLDIPEHIPARPNSYLLATEPRTVRAVLRFRYCPWASARS